MRGPLFDLAAEKREKGWGTHAFSACAARLSDFLLCLSCRECPIRPYGAPSPRGEGYVSGIAASSYRSLPHLGRGTASAEDRVLSCIAYLRRSPSLSFIPLEPYPARFARHLPHAGKALAVVILFFSTYACIRSDNARKAVSSYRSLPHWGRGTASAVDRVLSYIAYLRRSPSLSFIPPVPYPPLWGTFPTRGRLCVGDTLF